MTPLGVPIAPGLLADTVASPGHVGATHVAVSERSLARTSPAAVPSPSIVRSSPAIVISHDVRSPAIRKPRLHRFKHVTHQARAHPPIRSLAGVAVATAVAVDRLVRRRRPLGPVTKMKHGKL